MSDPTLPPENPKLSPASSELPPEQRQLLFFESHQDEEDGVTLEVVEPGEEGEEKLPRRGVYLLPSLITTGAMFAAFYSIVASTQGRFELAAVTIFVAGILDGLDGRIARITHTQSAFGAEYDSLSDMIAFGLAPALLAYNFALYQLGKLGWMIAFVYVACAALRLARFNVQIGSTDKRFFVGLPSPVAAATVTAPIWFVVDRLLTLDQVSAALALLVLLCGLMMVSNCSFPSFKEVHLSKRVPLLAIVGVVLMFALIFTDPPLFLSLIAISYTIGGICFWIVRRIRKLKSPKNKLQ